MDDKHLEVCSREFEAEIERQVEREFEAARALPDAPCRTPITGEEYDPHGPPEQIAVFKRRAVRAVIAQKWFEDEVPRSWGLTLPLKPEDCTALLNGDNQGKRRPSLVWRYAVDLRSKGWDLRYATPFELFCAEMLSSPAEPMLGARHRQRGRY